jgi:tetratricopeptide (TPR) repeat protein
MNDDQNAVATVKTLISTDSTNVQYHLVYGTELYKMAMTMNDTLTNRYNRIFDLQQKQQKNNNKEYQSQIDELQNSNQQLASNIEDMTGKAKTQLQYVINHRPNDPTAYNTMGVIYQNKAAALFQMRNNTNDLKKADSLDAAAKNVLKQALPFYQKAAQLDPNNQNYWQSLFRVYTALGMKEKAQEAMKKAGLN